MEFNVRTLKKSDFKTITSWWKEWDWPILPKDFLPDNGTGGIMVEKNNNKIVCGFLYFSNSKLVWLDWIVSNPKYRQKDRKEAIKLLIQTAENMVENAGCKYVMSISRSNSLLKIHENLGWVVDPTPSHEMTKGII
tara:strand:+ start:51 stop:458 length:408 start_codon:yes stop_codon:yes gene_type:complete